MDKLRDLLRDFAKERDWDQFHSPKNLAMALVVEAGEIVEHFQWLPPVACRDPFLAELTSSHEQRNRECRAHGPWGFT